MRKLAVLLTAAFTAGALAGTVNRNKASRKSQQLNARYATNFTATWSLLNSHTTSIATNSTNLSGLTTTVTNIANTPAVSWQQPNATANASTGDTTAELVSHFQALWNSLNGAGIIP